MFNKTFIVAVSLSLCLVKSDTIFYDSMDNAVVTGWSFVGSYLAPTNSGSCPNGGYCTQLTSGSTTPMMRRTFNITGLYSLTFQYDIHCQSYCRVRYKYDNQANYLTLYSTTAGDTTKTSTLAKRCNASSVYVEFYGGTTSDSVWVDNFYLNAETTPPTETSSSAIFYDSMDNAVVTGWSFVGSYLAPTNSGSCPNGGYCTQLTWTSSTIPKMH
eukprot:295942_1